MSSLGVLLSCLLTECRGESLGVSGGRGPDWSSGEGLYPLQAMVQPIELRFKYHFQGSRGTNRIDKVIFSLILILDSTR